MSEANQPRQLTPHQEVALNQLRNRRGQFARAPVFDVFPAGTLEQIRVDRHSIVPVLPMHNVDGNGDCFYNALEYVSPPPIDPDQPNREFTLRERSFAQRQQLSDYYRRAVGDREEWTLNANFMEIYPDHNDPTPQRVTPIEFADAMLRDGWEGHWGETFEAEIYARLNRTNVAIVVVTTTITTNAETPEEQQREHRELQVYPVREDTALHDPFAETPTLNPAYPTVVLYYESTITGIRVPVLNERGESTGRTQHVPTQPRYEHYQVVRSFQLGPPDTNQVVPGERTYLSERLTAERERQARETRFTASGGRVRSASVDANDERDSSVGPARRRRGGHVRPNPLQSDYFNEFSFVYRYAAKVDHSHDFPPNKSFLPVTTQRMVNDSNGFYRAVAYMRWGDEGRWREVREFLARYFLEQWESSAPWTEDERYTRIHRINADGQLTQHAECTPDVYAADMLDEDHPGSDAEWHIVTRALNCNIVAASKEQVEGREELRFQRYPFLERDQPNQLADRLEPKRDTGVVLIEGSHTDVVTSYNVATPAGRARTNAQLKRCIAQPAPERRPQLPTRQSTRTAAVEIRERMERERQQQYELDLQRQREQAARERSNLPRLDPPQGRMCHTRASHRNAMAGCAGRDVNHQVEYFDVGGFTYPCPWGCGALHLKSEHEKMAKPRPDGTATAGLMAKCCRNGRTDTEEMRNINHILANPPKIIRELSDPNGPHPEAKVALQDSIKINSHFAFASVSTVTKDAPAHGVQPIIANGEFKWRLSDLYPPDAKRDQPAFGQYYVLTPEEAIERRMESNETYRPRLTRETMEALDAAIRNNHPFANLYHTADEMLKQAIRDRPGQPLPRFEIVLLTNREAEEAELADPSIHPHRTDLPVGDGQQAVALIWINDEGTVNPVEQRRGIRLHGKEGRIVDFHHFNPNIFPACYPYLNPYGIQGYRFGMRYRDTAATANPANEPDANAVYDEDEPDDAALIVDPADREHLPKRRQFMSARDWHSNTMAFRADPKTGYQWLSGKGPAAEQYILGACVQVEQHEQEYKKEKTDLRSVLPKDLIDLLQKGLPPGQTLGKVYLASKNWKGSRSHMQQAYADAMTMFDKLGAPQLFLTFTGNPSWPEIKAALKQGQSFNHNPAAVTRIFWEKWEELKKDIVEREIFGPVKCFVYSVEYQKRGMPHIHMLITLDQERLRLSPQFVDNIISAEIPAKPDECDQSAEAKQQRALRDLVAKHQMHTCSDYCLRDDGTCEKHFPREFSAETVTGESFTRYKRRAPDEGGELINLEGRGYSALSSNQYVVPYNEFLLLKYGSHHNLEYVGSYEKTCEYALKYLMKGGDMAYVQVSKAGGSSTGITDYDEVKAMFKVRYMTAMEAKMRLDGRPVVKLSHIVHKLWVHSPNSANMIVEEGREEEGLPAAEAAVEGGGRRTMLTAFFERCARPESDAVIEAEGYVRGPKANDLLYEDFPRFYHFDRMARTWIRRKRLDGTAEEFLARIGSVNAHNSELTAIRILLQNTRGPTSWNDLKTVRAADGQLHTYFPNDPEMGYHDAAVARGLLENNAIWIRTLEEADRERMGCRAFRRFFASTLVHSIPPDRQALFDHFVDSLSPRRGRETREQQVERAYQLLEYIFRQWDSSCRENGLRGPAAYNERDVVRDMERAAQNEQGTQYVADDPDAHRSRDWWRRYADDHKARFNPGQAYAFNRIIESLADPSARSLFQLKGEGGTGKTFVYNTLIAELHARGEEIIVTGTTGVAATLLLTGRTAHSAFRIPTDVDSTDAPRISGQEQLAQRLRRARVIIIDEMTMMNKDVINYIDRTLRSLYTGPEKDLPFAGKGVCISGDWKQRLPIVKGARRPGIVRSTIKYSESYHLFETLTLTENMRMDPAEREYQDWTKLVGNGLNFVEVGSELIEVDQRNLVENVQELIDFVFPREAIADPLRFADDVADSAILCYTNEHVDRLNAELMARIRGEEYILPSLDRPLNVAQNNALNIHNADQNLEYIHSKRPGNMPPHLLKVKKGCITILTKNLDIESGLCNGTRLQLLDVKHVPGDGRVADQPMPVATCRVLTGKSRGKLISLIPSRFQHGLERNSREAPFERIQLPMVPALVMTADKAQGQTLKRVGLHLVEKEAFAHGHVYVPITRIKKRSHLKILPNRTNEHRNLIRNVVWPEVLDPEDRAQVMHRGDNPPSPPPPPPPPQADSGSGNRSRDATGQPPDSGRCTRERDVDNDRPPHNVVHRQEESATRAISAPACALAHDDGGEEVMEQCDEESTEQMDSDAERQDREREMQMREIEERIRQLDAVLPTTAERAQTTEAPWIELTDEMKEEKIREVDEQLRQFEMAPEADDRRRTEDRQRETDETSRAEMIRDVEEQMRELDAKMAEDEEKAKQRKEEFDEYTRRLEFQRGSKQRFMFN